MDSVAKKILSVGGLKIFATGIVGAFALTVCGSELAPPPERAVNEQPTFVAVDVTAPPESPTATPWPFSNHDGVRSIPEGLDPELFAQAESTEVVNLWRDLLTGSVMHATSEHLYFRGRGRFDAELHMCPAGIGYMDGDPSGDAEWSLSPSVGDWFEVSLTHEIPGRVEAVTFVLSIRDGAPVRPGSPEPIEFVESDFCSTADPGVERPSFTVEQRRLDERIDVGNSELVDIPWVDGEREFPIELENSAAADISPKASVDHWNSFLIGGAVDAVAYDYGTFVLTEAFSGSLHMCGGRVAILEGEPSGVGEWAVQSTGTSGLDAKILFTLPGDRVFRTLVLSVDDSGPVLMGRNNDTGLIAPSPIKLRESRECGG